MISLQPKISVIIVNYNGERFLRDCLDSLNSQTFRDYEVILVDNCSSDGSIEIITREYPHITLIQNTTNVGFAGGSNQGIRIARGVYILTLNNDTRLTPTFLNNIVRAMEEDPQVGICASKMLLPNGRINSTGLCISRSGAAWNRGMSEPDTGQYNQEQEVFGACAGAALYRKTMLDDIGLFDDDFFMYMEDVDLSFRAHLAGWKCVYIPSAVLEHHHGGTAGFSSDIAVYYGNRNIVWMIFKNFPAIVLLTSLPWIIGRNIGVVLYYSLGGRYRLIIRSKTDAIKGLSLSFQKRNRYVQKVPNREISRWLHMWCIQGVR